MTHTYARYALLGFIYLLLNATLTKPTGAEEKPGINIHVVMMESTCKIVGQGSIGTGFIIGRPSSEQPERLFYTLITAHHVLAASQGEGVILVFRRLKADNQWERVEVPLLIREGEKELWQKHADVDLAAIHVALPKDVIRVVVPLSLLVGDERLREWEVSPGAELLCLGYPFGAEANPEGFPILRSGRIASYPLLPTKKTKTFLFDFTVFRGNSGGPVYLYERAPLYGGSIHVGAIQGIVGWSSASGTFRSGPNSSTRDERL